MSLYIFTNEHEHDNEHDNDKTTRTYINAPSISRNSSKNKTNSMDSMDICSSFSSNHSYICAFPYDEEMLKHNDPIRDALFHSKHLNVDILDIFDDTDDNDDVSNQNETYTPTHMNHDLDEDEIIKELMVPLKTGHNTQKNTKKEKKKKNKKNKMNKFIKSIKHWFS